MSPVWQGPAASRERAPERPDGSSTERPTHPPASNNGTPVHAPAALKIPPKLLRFNGAAQLQLYLAQVQLAAQHNGWSSSETATHLALALEEPALQTLLDLSPDEQHDLQSLTVALGRRWSGATGNDAPLT